MAIKEEKPITMAEVLESVKESENSQKIKEFTKKFNPLDLKEALKMKEELKALDLIKLKEFDLVKIIDLKPKDAVELNKILPEISLDNEEITKILDVVKKY